MDYRHWLDFIFPLSDDEKLLRACQLSEFVDKANLKYHQDFISLLPYHDPVVRAAIHLTKYHAHKKSAQFLAAVLNNFLSGFDPDTTIIIPTPLSRERRQQRGYNQVTLVANLTNFPIEEKLLKRHRHTLAQTSLQKKDRINNVAGAFSVTTRPDLISDTINKHIILLDDVVTTGSTLLAARDPLVKAKYRKITCVALAH